MSEAEKPELKPANENPWYCLATLYGEHSLQGDWDRDLATKNRVAWNRWIAGGLGDKQRVQFAKNGFPEPELIPFDLEEKASFCSAFAARAGRAEASPPDPADTVNFRRTHFGSLVSFDGFLFPDADFDSAKFSYRAEFVSAKFGHAEFHLTKFRHADFRSTAFFGFASFDSATFSGDARFESATFSDVARFRSTTFSGYAGFESATFSGSADFINAEFTSITAFGNANFESNVPDFRGTKMHEATEWHGVQWPSAPEDWLWIPPWFAQTQVYAYERLKQEMERLKKHEDEQFFFRKELRARRGLVRRWSGEWLLNWAYEVSSGYGQSLTRPTMWLLALFVLGVAAFAGFPIFEGARMTIPRAATLSFANIFSFLPIKRELMTADMISGLSSMAQIVGVVQSLLGIVLLFLLGLALRSRFRMR